MFLKSRKLLLFLIVNTIMKIFLTSICLILLSAAIKAQQIVVNSLYQNNISYYNPAYTASQYKLRGGLQYRRQWDNWPGAPVNYMGQYEHNLDSINSGIGITVMREENGFSTFQTALIHYRYELKLSHLNRLSVGLTGGAMNHTFEPFWIVTDPNDPSLPAEGNQTKFVMNAGAMLKLNRFRLGLSVLQLNRSRFDQLNYKSQLHTVFTADYTWMITRKFNVEPSVFFITDAHFMTLTGLLRANYNNKFWALTGYRSGEAIIFGLGAIIKEKFSVGYNLDIWRSRLLNSATTYSHGIYLNYQIQRRALNPYKISGTPDF